MIDKHGMAWTQVMDTDDSWLGGRFMIKGFPTKIVLGKDRRIIARYDGADKEFWPWLDELMK